ncbi:MAG TPA: chorismate-binding protein, partial [Acidimicrobiales bacterium]|nr:chorismate-binding protein [Acidimicrobiales bacterium]
GPDGPAMTERYLRATSLLLDDGPAIDAFALAGPSGIVIATEESTLVGVGVALSLPLTGGLEDDLGIASAQRRLAAIDTGDRVQRTGSGVLAFGSIPFDRSTPAALVVPELLYGRSADGAEWLTLVTDGPGAVSSPGWRAELLARSSSPDGVTGADPTTGPAGVQAGGPARSSTSLSIAPPSGALPSEALPSIPPPVITPLASDRWFVDAVARAVGDIRRGDLRKVVLARQIELTFDSPIDIPGLLRRWRGVEPTATVFSMPVDGAQFVGASPELLVARSGPTVRCRPLAGTSSRPPLSSTQEVSAYEGSARKDPTQDVSADDDPAPIEPSDIRTSTKDNSEHRFVVEAIADALGPVCEHLDVPSSPDLIHFHNVSHLGTSISGTLSGASSSRPSVLELVAKLHPTPAVGGVPRQRALEVIEELETGDRAHYAGPVGWMDAAGDGRWVVGIRAATIAGHRAQLAAGVGIVEGSDPWSELRETNWKFTAVFDALAPGHRLVAGNSRELRRTMTVRPERVDGSPRRAG